MQLFSDGLQADYAALYRLVVSKCFLPLLGVCLSAFLDAFWLNTLRLMDIGHAMTHWLTKGRASSFENINNFCFIMSRAVQLGENDLTTWPFAYYPDVVSKTMPV